MALIIPSSSEEIDERKYCLGGEKTMSSTPNSTVVIQRPCFRVVLSVSSSFSVVVRVSK